MANSGQSSGPFGWVTRGVRGTAWAVRKACWYGLPPIVYDSVRFPLKMLPPRIFQRSERERLRTALKRRFGPPLPDVPPPTLPAPPPAYESQAAYFEYLYQSYFGMAEGTQKEVEVKLTRLQVVCGTVRIDRARWFREAARLERMLDNDVKAALYKIRAMRLCGSDTYGDEPWVTRILSTNGYAPEAAAVHAMYAAGIDNTAATAALLEETRERLTVRPRLADEYEVFDDRRGSHKPRVSVLITVYNAADKVTKFLHALQLQTLNRRGELEVVIVDSQSPTDDYAAFKATELTFPIPMLYVRTKQRETIQTAWNRGLGLVRAPYVSLLGADECILPPALEKLADTLDAEPLTDWVQGSILLTEADAAGLQSADVMTYDRDGFVKDLVYLETTYLGPVGAMHRTSVHTRFGYFDGSFRGAGDTEFKNRVLPDITIKTLPDLFGLYVNYPEERTTQSPRAELEDVRAWYLHRTVAGMRHAYRHRPVGDIEAQLVRCLRYRKCYRPPLNRSTDFALATVLTDLLMERAPESPVLAALWTSVSMAVTAQRELDKVPTVRPGHWHEHVQHRKNMLHDAQYAAHLSGLVPGAEFGIFNDNCHEQHHTFW